VGASEFLADMFENFEASARALSVAKSYKKQNVFGTLLNAHHWQQIHLAWTLFQGCLCYLVRFQQ